MNKTKLSKLQKDVTVICDYLWEEEKHYEESNRPSDHIWCYVRRMRWWLKNSKK